MQFLIVLPVLIMLKLQHELMRRILKRRVRN